MGMMGEKAKRSFAGKGVPKRELEHKRDGTDLHSAASACYALRAVAGRRRFSMTRSKRLALIAAIVCGIVALDQITKVIAIAALTVEAPPGAAVARTAKPPVAFPKSWHPDDLFRFQYATNTGAFLSLGSRLPERARFWLLTCLNAVILTLLAGFLVFRRDIEWLTALALTLILSGGIGNMIDRFFRGGEVVDFMIIDTGIRIGSWPVQTGIFNIADLGIVGGLLLLVALEFFRRKPAPAANEGTGHEEN